MVAAVGKQLICRWQAAQKICRSSAIAQLARGHEEADRTSLSKWLREKLNHILSSANAEARTIIVTHRELVLDLDDALLKEGELTGPKLSYPLEKITRVQQCDKDDASEPTNPIMDLGPY
jgi:transposase-like protein